MAEIRLKNITHMYSKTVKAVDDLSMVCQDTKLTALLGPSGCGKTTLMRIIAGLIHPTQGEIHFDGKDVTELSPEKRDIAMVFQFPVVYSTMSIHDNLALPLKAKKLPRSEVEKMVKSTAEFLDLIPHLKRSAGKLTADLKQATSLGRAVIRHSNILLLDEPLTNLDPRYRGMLRDKIVSYKKETGQTIMYVTHDQGEALTLGDKIGVMKDGKLLQYDSLPDIYDRPLNSFIASFLGNPGMNLIDCDYRRTASAAVLESGDFSLRLSEEKARAIERESVTEVVLGIRPEHVRLERGAKDGFQAQCEVVEDAGNLRIVGLDVGGKRIRAKTLIADIMAGEKVSIHLPEDKLRIFRKDGEVLV
jgi:glycerol transport system ATP-binding protein